MAMFGNSFRPRTMLAEGDLPEGSPAATGTTGVMPGDQPLPSMKRRGLFGRPGAADAMIDLGMSILAANGNPIGAGVVGFRKLQQDREDQQFQNLYRAALAKKALEPDARFEAVPGPDGKPYAQRNTVTGEMKPLPGREPTSWQERVIARLMDPATPQPEKDILRPMLTGFQYTEPGMAAAAQLAGQVTAAREAANPDRPTGQLTEMQKAELRAQANRAIQAGGNRAAIMQRLREMGVN